MLKVYKIYYLDQFMKAGMMPMHINPAMLGMQGINPIGGNPMGGIPIVQGPNGAMMVMMPSGMNPQQQGSNPSNNQVGQNGPSNIQIPGMGVISTMPFPGGMINPYGINLSQLGQQQPNNNNQNPQNSNDNKSANTANWLQNMQNMQNIQNMQNMQALQGLQGVPTIPGMGAMPGQNPMMMSMGMMPQIINPLMMNQLM